MRERFKEIQNLRAFGILAVVTIHSVAGFASVHKLTSVTATAMAIDSLSTFAVPLFIFISGIVLTINLRPVKYHLLRRCGKMVIVYAIFSVVYAVFFHKPIVYSILHFNAAPHLSFFNILIGLYILFPLLYLVAGRLHWGIMLPAMLAIQLGYLYIPAYRWILPTIYFLSHIFYFVGGIYVGLNYSAILKRMECLDARPIAIVAVVFWIVLYIAWLNRFFHIDVPNYETIIMPMLFTTMIILLYKMAISTKADWLQNLGNNAFGIYLVHLIPLTLIRDALLNHGMTFQSPIIYVILFILTISISYLASWIWGLKGAGFRSGSPA